MQERKPIEEIFRTLRLAYGAEFMRNICGGTPETIKEVKEFWEKRLEYWLDKPYAIDWALENLPARCPNVIEFHQLCEQAPKPQLMQLPAPQPEPTPERLAVIERLLEECKESLRKPVEPPSYRIWQKVQRGEPVAYYTRQFYKKDFEKYSSGQKPVFIGSPR